jgi:hypothetical protein
LVWVMTCSPAEVRGRLPDTAARRRAGRRAAVVAEAAGGGEARAGPAYEDSGYVVTDELGAPVHPKRFSDDFHRVRETATLPRIRLHDARHTIDSLLADASRRRSDRTQQDHRGRVRNGDLESSQNGRIKQHEVVPAGTRHHLCQIAVPDLRTAPDLHFLRAWRDSNPRPLGP